MDTKKTIFVSVATTLATLFVVVVLIHLFRGNCNRGDNSCSAKTECYAHSKCQKSNSCASYSHCSKKSECNKSSSCSGKSKCSKGKAHSKKEKISEEKISEDEK